MPSGATENPLHATGSATVNIDPKLEAVEGEVARLRLKLETLQTNFSQAQQHTAELVHNAALDGRTISSLLTEIKTEKSQAIEQAKARMDVASSETKAYVHKSPNCMLTLIEGIEKSQKELQPVLRSATAAAAFALSPSASHPPPPPPPPPPNAGLPCARPAAALLPQTVWP